MINWPDFTLPPINLWSAPYYESKRCLGLCDKSGQYCKNCHRLNPEFPGDQNANQTQTPKSNH